MILEIAETETPLGAVTIAVDGDRLRALCFSDYWPEVRKSLERWHGRLELSRAVDPAGVATRLRRYFDGDLAATLEIRVDPSGTDFQKRVWSALRKLPAGQTASYRELARSIGHPEAVRAVGAANGSNPIWLVIPCHRVIASDGTLGGYGGGLDRKRWLLEHEGALERSPQLTLQPTSGEARKPCRASQSA
jgi:methylated-DNA-[protein]-cysteine S-methyltransferase